MASRVVETAVPHPEKIGRAARQSADVMRATFLLPTAAFLVLAGGPATRAPQSYLDRDAFDLLTVLPPPPAVGDARDRADRAIFVSTRRFAGTPRWDLARNDVASGPAEMMRDFSCALGVTLTPANAPLLLAVADKASIDTARQTNAAKRRYKRLRPFMIDQGPICQPRFELRSYDYPSGHTTRGWTWATILAEIAPDRATAILARGRAYGESRIVCGVYNRSAVEAGLISASATMAVVRAQPAFQADLAAARLEIDALRHDPAAPRPAACDSEAALVALEIR